MRKHSRHVPDTNCTSTVVARVDESIVLSSGTANDVDE